MNVAHLSPAAQCILNTVQRLGPGTSFVEVERDLEASGLPARGKVSVNSAVAANVCIWTGISEEFFTGLDQLFTAKLVHYKPTSPLVYLIDGGMLRLPLANRIPKDGYKKPHWLPVTLTPGPAPRQPVLPSGGDHDEGSTKGAGSKTPRSSRSSAQPSLVGSDTTTCEDPEGAA